MGVPAFFSWLLKHHPTIVIDSSQFRSSDSFHGLYIDGNSLLHEFLSPEDGSLPPKTFGALVDCVCGRIDELVALVNPKMLLFIALDGDAPAAKHGGKGQQKRRGQPCGTVIEWNTPLHSSPHSYAKPKTLFMVALESKLKEFVQNRLQDHPRWSKVRVVISDSSIDGEGEQKMLNHYRYECNAAGSGSRTSSTCFYGRDADLIMLGLAVESSYRLYVLRHSCNASSSTYSRDKFIDIGRLRTSLVRSVTPWFNKQRVGSEHKIARELVFACFLLGNDFLPGLHGLDVKTGGLDLLLHTYAAFLDTPKRQPILSDNGKINAEGFYDFLKDLARRLEGISVNSTNGVVPSSTLAIEYVQGLQWLVDYYFYGICGGWYFSGAIAPRASEIREVCATPSTFCSPSSSFQNNPYIVETCSRYSKLKKVELSTRHLGPQWLTTAAH